jgi:hypothetical protein
MRAAAPEPRDGPGCWPLLVAASLLVPASGPGHNAGHEPRPAPRFRARHRRVPSRTSSPSALVFLRLCVCRTAAGEDIIRRHGHVAGTACCACTACPAAGAWAGRQGVNPHAVGWRRHKLGRPVLSSAAHTASCFGAAAAVLAWTEHTDHGGDAGAMGAAGEPGPTHAVGRSAELGGLQLP